MGKLRPGGRQALAQGHQPVSIMGRPCASPPSFVIFPAPERMLRFAGGGPRNFRPISASLGHSRPSTPCDRVGEASEGAHRRGADGEGSHALEFPDRPAHSCWVPPCHLQTPPCVPAHSAHCLPQTLGAASAPGLRHRPTPSPHPIPRWGSTSRSTPAPGPSPERHPWHLPWNQARTRAGR